MVKSLPAIKQPKGRPRRKPHALLGDRGYGFPWTIAAIALLGILSLLCPRGSPHGSGLGERRYVIERTMSWFGNFRRLKLCYERTGQRFLTFHQLAASVLCPASSPTMGEVFGWLLSGMRSAIEALCERCTDVAKLKCECQAMIDAAPAVSPGHVSAQVFDRLKRMREGSPLGDALDRAAKGDRNAMANFFRVTAQEEMFRTFGSYIVRFTSTSGEGLGTGVLTVLPSRMWGVMTCSHVWAQLTKLDSVQMYCACPDGPIGLSQRMIEVPVDHLCTLDMADRDFMDRAGVDALMFKRDSAIIAGRLKGLLPKGARAFDLRNVSNLEPRSENYALVGYPRAAHGELGSVLLEYETSATNTHVFVRHANDKGAGSLNGASGGLVVAVRRGNYRAVGLMVEEHGGSRGGFCGNRGAIQQPFRLSCTRALQSPNHG